MGHKGHTSQPGACSCIAGISLIFPLRAGSPESPWVPGVPTIGGKGFGDWKRLTWFHVSSMRQQHDLVGGL